MTITSSDERTVSFDLDGGVYGQLYINGEWREASDGARVDVVRPGTGAVIGSVAAGTTDDVDAAVKAARAAYDSGVWSGMPARERARVLRRVADLIRENADELTAIESADAGKPISTARMVDIGTAAEQFEYVASLTYQLDGSVRETPFPAHAFTRRESIGVVAAITPFNFPLILSSTKIAPALAMGNTVVHKPASDTPLSALRMVEIFEQAGVPAGVINIVTGSGSVMGDALTNHEGVDKIAFTGSTKVGSHIASEAGRNVKPITAELGGNGAHIVFADANLDEALGPVIGGAIHNAGQFCMAGTRILVERPIYDQVVEALGAAVGGITPADPADPASELGPLASQKQLDLVAGMVERAVEGGARIVTGGKRLGGEGVDGEGGFYYAPTVITDVADADEIVSEEIFGPVLTVQPFDTEDEAIARANGTKYGLAAGLQTTDLKRAHRVAPQLKAGMVWINTWGLLDPAMPFGGVKASGMGREMGPEVLNNYTQSKSVVMGL